LRIGALRVDPALDEIERDGQTIKLEPRSMRLLVCLAERAGDVVSVEELLQEVWKGVVVTPVSVYQAVAGLRRVMGDDAKNPVYIANVVRRGYRLIAPVSAESPPAAPSPAAAPPMPVLPLSALPVPEPAVSVPATDAQGRPPTRRLPGSSMRWGALGAFLLLAVAVPLVWTDTRPKATPAQVEVRDSSVGVLPFRDLSDDRHLQYLADGLTEEIIDLLGNVPGLRVPGRTSSLYFKDKSVNAQEIARILGVSHLLEGSVRRVGDNLRITTALSRADSGYQVWSQTYEVGGSEIVAIQHDIAAAVARNLSDLMLPATPLAAASPSEVEAYDAVLKARFLLSHGVDAENREAIDVLQGALAHAPTYAAAWAELARAHRHRASHFDETPDHDIAVARAEARKALAIDPRCVGAHNVLADIARTYDYDPVAGAREVAAVRALDAAKAATNGDLLDIYSGCVLGPCYEKVIRDTNEQMINDPLNPIPYWMQALARYMFGDFAGAERDIRHAIALSPGNEYQQFLLARILFARLDRVQLQAMTKTAPDSLHHRASLVLAFQALGRDREADAALRDLTLHNASDGAYQIAEMYAASGRLNDAMSWLERAYLQHDSGLWAMKADPFFRKLADDQRFIALEAQLHM
jgi:TolB-like protein/DNA-binding winged helix-turn-helix (wHTH) protein/Tfp pilus assembly protein PilF